MFKPVDPNVNFPEMEKKWLKEWYEKGVVNKYLKKNSKSTKTFSFLDGPITANNPMGVHHAWGRTYKDLWPKFYNLLGYRQRFQNGFDCQGLWVEVEVEKDLGLKSKKEIENIVPHDKKASIAKFVELCKQRVYKYAKVQTQQSKRLGYFADWDNSYYTMSDENNYMIWHFLKKCFENGWIYKGRESVPWCPRCETAISEHEILTEDYKVVTHESIYFLLPLIDQKNEYLLVWTTTPWTIPANIAVAVDENLDYSLLKTEKGKVWLATETISRVIKSKDHKVIKKVKGKELVGLKYEGPFDQLASVSQVAKENPKTFHHVIPTDNRILPITVTEGTGMVHTAVSAGTEDFRLGKKLGLPMIPVIDDNANYLPGLGFLTGKSAKKNPRLVLDYLEKNGFAFKIFDYKHRYPACWRCKTELVWKVEDEWYIAMDKESKKLGVESWKLKNKKITSNLQPQTSNLTLRQKMIEVAKKIRWMPGFGLDRELDWLKNMHDWLISKKNRYWGLALPIYECRKCRRFEVLGSKQELKDRAVKGWDEFAGHTPHKPFIDEVLIECSNCAGLVKRIDDVGNPWLDAGIVGYSTITEDNRGKPLYLKDKAEWRKWFPVDFITESFPGQFKNWFYALIAESTVLENTPQFKTVLGFGTLLGEDGRPMHKSWGNAIEFNEGADKIGVDVMRWMYARQSPEDNMLFGYKHADEVRRQFYLMLWNIYKYFIEYANLDKYEAISIKYDEKNQQVLDLWIVNRLHWLIDFVKENLKNYNVKDVALEAEKFVSDLSTWYIRRSRDRVWVNSESTKDKQVFYQTLHFVLVQVSLVLSPILPFVSEEIFTNLTDEVSVHLAMWPEEVKDMKVDQNLIHDMNTIREIVEVGHRIRKEEQIKVRQKLSKVMIKMPQNKKFMKSNFEIQYLNLIKDELNTTAIYLTYHVEEDIEVGFDTRLTDELLEVGKIRELIRNIQKQRKQMNLRSDTKISLTLPEYPKKYESMIKRKVLAVNISVGDTLVIKEAVDLD